MKTGSDVLEIIGQRMRDNPEGFDDEDLIEVLIQAVGTAFYQLAPYCSDDFSGTFDVTIHSLGCALLRYDQHRPQLH